MILDYGLFKTIQRKLRCCVVRLSEKYSYNLSIGKTDECLKNEFEKLSYLVDMLDSIRWIHQAGQCILDQTCIKICELRDMLACLSSRCEIYGNCGTPSCPNCQYTTILVEIPEMIAVSLPISSTQGALNFLFNNQKYTAIVPFGLLQSTMIIDRLVTPYDVRSYTTENGRFHIDYTSCDGLEDITSVRFEVYDNSGQFLETRECPILSKITTTC